MVGVLGNNGSGKSTFLNVLSGQMDFAGSYRIGGRPFEEMSQMEIGRASCRERV